MSGFMDYLNNIDKEIIENSVNEETKVEEVTKVPKKQKIVEKDVSVNIIEDRLRTKLYNVGLNDKIINEVVSYVLSNTVKVEGFNPVDEKPIQKKEEVSNKQVNEKERIPNSIKGYAESLLEGLPEDYTPTINEDSSQNMKPRNDMSNVADRASALL